MVDMLSAFDAVVEEGLIEEVKKANEFPVIPCGKYPATLVKMEDISSKQTETFNNGGANKLYGKPVVNLQMKLEGVGPKGYDELDGSSRTTFLKMCPVRVTGVDKNGREFVSRESQLATKLVTISETAGKPFSAALEWLEQNKIEVVIGHYTTADGTKKDQVVTINKLA